MTGCNYRKTSALRRRNAARLMVALLTVLLQLQMFLHLELHGAVLGPSFHRLDASPATAAWSVPPKAAPARRPFCLACLLARQGAVQPSAGRAIWRALRTVAAVRRAHIANPPARFIYQSSGRDPPRA